MRLNYNPTKQYKQKQNSEELTVWDSDEESELINEDTQNFETPGNYVFVIDRSGSMGGNPMKMANEALVILLKSLSEGSTFNIVSFGSEFEFLCDEGNLPVTQKHIQDSISKVKKF